MYSDILLHEVTLAKTNKRYLVVYIGKFIYLIKIMDFFFRYLLCIQNLHNKLNTSQNKIKDISSDSINNIVNDLNEPQKNIVQEIYKASLVKKSKEQKIFRKLDTFMYSFPHSVRVIYKSIIKN